MMPGIMEVAVPQGWKVGDKVASQGPHGRIILELPENSEPGTTIRYHLRPGPDLFVEVPAGAKPGGTLYFQQPDGMRIALEVPQGKKPGELFEVRPPALMVIVPEGVKPGSHVVFRAPLESKAARDVWFRAEVPEVLELGRYFAARMPPPGKPQEGGKAQKQPGKQEGEKVALLRDAQQVVSSSDEA